MPKIPLYPPFKEEPIIKIEYRDQCVAGSNGFRTVKEFVEFLNDNPIIAITLGYIPKKS